MPDPNRARLDLYGGASIALALSPRKAQDRLLAAMAEGKYCKLPEDSPHGKMEILVNPEAVQVIRPVPSTSRFEKRESAPLGALRKWAV
jgi:hypothetical protein